MATQNFTTMTPPMDVKFQNISYHVTPSQSRPFLPPKRLPPVQILHDISAYVPAGQSLAILGPSGSGKTTLLNILAARTEDPPSSGSITFSGRPRHPRTKRHIGYVMQDDIFLSQLTVRQTLDFTASVRLPKSFSDSERAERVDHVLKRLRLTKCQHTRVGRQSFDRGISGGERKRLNIANELLHEPSLLLADECTSGLDSSSAYTVIEFLSELCTEGRTVIVTIHQPSSQMFMLFDRIMLLAAGRIAYCGPSTQMIAYFEAIDFPFPTKHYNPADYALQLVIDKGDDADDKVINDQTRILDAWRDGGATRVAELSGHVACSGEKEQGGMVGEEEAVAQMENHITVDVPTENRKGSLSDATPELWDNVNRPGVLSLEQPDWPDAPSSRVSRLGRAAHKRWQELTARRESCGVPDKYPSDWGTQVRALARRAATKKQGLMSSIPQILQLVFTTGLMCVLWWRMPAQEGGIEDRLGALCFVPFFWMVFSTIGALNTFPPERDVLFKDRASGSYRLSAYFFSKLIVETPADMLFPIVSSSVMYYAINLNPDVRAFILFVMVVTLTNVYSQSLGLFISATFSDYPTAQVITNIWMQMSILSSGYLVNPDNLPSIFRVLRHINFLKYSYEALVQTEMSFGRTIDCAEGSNPVHTVYSNNGQTCPITKVVFLRAAQIDSRPSLGVNILVQVLFIVVFRLLAYMSLKLLHTKHKPKISFWTGSQ